MWNEELVDIRRHCQLDEPGVVATLDRSHLTHPVHMPLNDVTAKAIAGPHGALEVDAMSHVPLGDGGAIECGDDGRRGEPMRTNLAHGETSALTGDAFADDDVVIAAGNPKFAPRFRVVYFCNGPHVIHEPGEHQAASFGTSCGTSRGTFCETSFERSVGASSA